MTRPDDVNRLIDRWDDAGLLEDGQADRLRHDLDEHGLPGDGGPDEAEGTQPSQLFEAAISAGLEAIGYLGAVLVLGALAYLTDVPSWPRPGLVVLLAALSGVAAFAVTRWTPADPGPSSRLVTVVGTAGIASVVGLFGVLFDWSCGPSGCNWASERLQPLALAGPGTAAAAWLHLRERNAVTHAWLGLGVAATVWVVSQAFLPVGATWRTEQVTAALFLLPASVAWMWATETERITPAWIGTFGAAWLGGAMLLSLADFDIFDSSQAGPPLALLAYGAALVVAGVTWERWRLTLVGALSLVWAIPWTMVDVLELSEETTALVLLPVGLALLVYVIRRLTADRRQPTQ